MAKFPIPNDVCASLLISDRIASPALLPMASVLQRKVWPAAASSAHSAAGACRLSSTSLWQSSSWDSTSHVDVAVVGGGICGLGAALEAQQRGQRVAVLEAGVVGCGASGRNAGFLIRGFADNFKVATEQFGVEAAQALWRFTEANIAALQDVGVMELHSVQAKPSCLLALDAEEAADLEATCALMGSQGLEAELVYPGQVQDSVWRGGAEDGAPRPLVGLVNPGDRIVNPMHILSVLQSALTDPVHEHCPVHDISPTSDGEAWCLSAGHGRVLARQVLVATNGYTQAVTPSLLPEAVGALAHPVKGQMVSGTMPGLELAFAYYADRGDKYFREGPGGSLLMGGCRRAHAASQVGTDDATSKEVQGSLAAFAQALLGAPFAPQQAWCGTMGFSPDGLPAAGPVLAQSKGEA